MGIFWTRKLIAAIILSPVYALIVGSFERANGLVPFVTGNDLATTLGEVIGFLVGAFIIIYLVGFVVGVILNRLFPGWWKKEKAGPTGEVK